MQLSLISLIDDSLTELKDNEPTIRYVEENISKIFANACNKHSESYIGIKSRIKTKNSLKEKIIRNKFYLDCKTGREVLDNLHDLIGVKIQCRFISDEEKMLTTIKKMFQTDDNETFKCIYDENLFLDLKLPQPQLQNNGFTIYRLDGYYLYNDRRVNYELQIKSLVHNFWAEIEHEVVYKNNQLVYNDKFMKNLLATINDNLEIVDHQLQIVYQQIGRNQDGKGNIGMNQEGFKLFLSRSINDLYNLKMMENFGINLNFKKCSGILSQYIYIKDFINVDDNQFRMIEYFEQFNLLKEKYIDFTNHIKLELSYDSDCKFKNTLAKYWEDILNEDFEWHTFFVMLFAIEPGNNLQDFSMFLNVIKNLLLPDYWLNSKFINYPKNKRNEVIAKISESLAITMVNYRKIDMIFEHKLISLHDVFKEAIDSIDETFDTYDKFEKYQDDILATLNRKLRKNIKEVK